MQYRYKDERTRSVFEDDKVFAKKYGHKALKNRDRRLAEIANYSTLAELLRLGKAGPGRWHVLDGRNGGIGGGKISGDLTGNLRLLLAPPDHSYGITTTVVIIEIKDTHKRNWGELMSVKPTRPAPLLPPGTYIEEWLEDQPMKQKELAMRLGTSAKHLSRLINGYVPISPEMALKLALVTGYSAEFWLTHQARYDARRTLLDISQDDIALMKSVLPGPCVSRLQKAGIVTHNWRNPQELVREVFSRGRVACADSFRDLCAGSGGGAATSGADWTWLELVKEQLGAVGTVPAFDGDGLRELTSSLRSASAQDPSSFVPAVRRMLQSVGVIFLAEPAVPGSHVSGASFEYDGNPVIALADGQKREDVFWFALFHEVAHVLTADRENDSSADNWAANELLDSTAVATIPQPFTAEGIVTCASEHAVSPAIVVGSLRRQGKVSRSWGADLIRRFEIS